MAKLNHAASAIDALKAKDNYSLISSLEGLANYEEIGAYILLASIYSEGIGMAKQPEKAFRWLSLAAGSGDLGSRSQLVDYYIKGMGTQKNYALALGLLDSLEESASNKARQGRLWLQGGYGIEKDSLRGIKLLEAAAFAKDKGAAFSLGKSYLNGVGVEKDLDAAISWLSTAKEYGSEEAANLLASIAKPTDPPKAKPVAKKIAKKPPIKSPGKKKSKKKKSKKSKQLP